MKVSRRARWAVIAVASASALTCGSVSRLRAQTPAAAASPEASAAGSQSVMAITQPSERHKLTFAAPGIISETPVKDGELVKQGQVLMSQDDFLESKELQKAQLEATSAAKVEAAQADYNAKKHIYEKKKKSMEAGAANQQEVEDAELDMILREKQINVAQDDMAEAKIKAEQEAKKVKDMHLTSPVDGVVERRVLEVGEMADPQKPEAACWVVKNDPLFVEIRDLSSRQVGHLHLGDKLQVKYPDDAQWQEATVTFRAPVVDAASDTQLVKLTLPNPNNRDSGLQIQVQLPPEIAQATEPREKTATAGNP